MNKYMYCICCKKLMNNEDGGKCFKTGYYKYSYRLGTCRECGEKCAESAAAYTDEQKQPS